MLADGYTRARGAGLQDGDFLEFWMTELVSKMIPQIGDKLGSVGALLYRKLGEVTARDPCTPPIMPHDLLDVIQEADAMIVWHAALGLIRQNGADHISKRRQRDEVRATTIINMLLFYRNQRWTWMARDLEAMLVTLPNTQTDFLNQIEVTLSARAGNIHRRLDAKHHPEARVSQILEGFPCRERQVSVSAYYDCSPSQNVQ